MSYFRAWDRGEDTEQLLDPSQQFSSPWGEPDHGRCDKCGGSGRTTWRCRSCLDLSDRGCEACGGRITFVAECPTCEGSGEISRTVRDGVSVFPTRGGLYRYLAERDVDVDGKLVVELEGPLSGDLDLDADAGALLVRPKRIVGVEPLPPTSAQPAHESM